MKKSGFWRENQQKDPAAGPTISGKGSYSLACVGLIDPLYYGDGRA